MAPIIFSTGYDQIGADITMIVCGAIPHALATLAFLFSKTAGVDRNGAEDLSSSEEMQSIVVGKRIGHSSKKPFPTD